MESRWNGDDAAVALDSVVDIGEEGPLSAVPLDSFHSAAPVVVAEGAKSAGSMTPDLSAALQVMEARKSIRRYRGTQEPTRPGLTWFLFALFLASMLYVPRLSGLHDIRDFPTIGELPMPMENTSSGNGTLLWLSVFGLSVGTWTDDPGEFEVIIATALILAFFSLCFIAIKAQVYFRLTLGNYILMLIILLAIIGRSSGTVDDLSPVKLIGPALIITFVIYFFYICIIIFLWKQLPKFQEEKGWMLPRIISKQAFRTPSVVKQMIAETYKASSATKRMGHTEAAVRITYCGWSSSFLPRALRKIWKRNFIVTYAGEVDETGRPHGFGEWNDNYHHGEVLTGWWEHGVPFGPFRSRESGTGAGFLRILVPYFRNRTDEWDVSNGSLDHGPIKCGICQVECCTAGIFFREYPKATSFLEVPPSGNVEDDTRVMLEELNSFPLQPDRLEALVLQADVQRGMLISGFNPADSSSPISATVTFQSAACGLAPGQKMPSMAKGLNQYLAQTYKHRLVAGDSDDEDAVSLWSDSDVESGRNQQLEQSPPARQGPVHAPRLSLPELDVQGWDRCTHCHNCEALIFLPGFNSVTGGSAKIMAQLIALGNFPSYIKTVIYSWPGGSLASYPSAQTICAEGVQTAEDLKQLLLALHGSGISKYHILTHSMGVRVLTAAIPQLEDLFLPSARLTNNNASDKSRPKMELCTVTLLNTEVGRHEFVDCYARRLTAMSPCVTLYADALDTALFGAELQNSVLKLLNPKRRCPVAHEDLSKAPERKRRGRSNSYWEYSLGRIKKDLLYADGTVVDIDVVQTTYLGANVQDVRHNAFSLNRELVDDLRDILVNRQRAFQRNTRLQYRGGNRYNFLVAPTHVVNP